MERPYIQRVLDLPSLVRAKSHFLLGPRQTGKTSLIRRTMQGEKYIDLLDSAVYLSLSEDPSRLAQQIAPDDRIAVIDEIQRLPALLNEVHRLIEERNILFLLTGSSARKLRRGGTNLLGGRARTKILHPLTRRELREKFDLSKAVEHGLLPSIYFSDDPSADLKTYVGTYLQQEILAEGVTRNLPAFSRFLKAASHCNSRIVNFTNVANDAQVARTTVYEYFEILKDTLVIHEVPAWNKSVRRKPLASSKYYFFDVGVAGALQGRMFRMETPEFGEAFETFIFQELTAWSDYKSGESVEFWRTKTGFEVDFVLGGHTAIEVKSGSNVSNNDLKSLRVIAEEKNLKRYICVCREHLPRKIGEIDVMPYEAFLDALWNAEFTG